MRLQSRWDSYDKGQQYFHQRRHSHACQCLVFLTALLALDHSL
jgi:hypothetical protein